MNSVLKQNSAVTHNVCVRRTHPCVRACICVYVYTVCVLTDMSACV